MSGVLKAAGCGRVVGVALLGVSLVAGCRGSGDASAAGAPGAAAMAPQSTLFQVVTVASKLEHPWGLAFLPDGRMLVTERSGQARLVSPDGKLGPALRGLPTSIDVGGQGGLLDVALDPDFATNRRVYFSFSEKGAGADSGRNSTAVWRAELNADATALTRGTVIFSQKPKVNSGGHFGGRLVFDREKLLFVTLGDRQSRSADAQDPGNHLGKVVRITTDGQPAPGNPFVGRAGTVPELWSIGHRNVQGAALHPGTGALWTHEHGPQGGDEVNLTRAGRNYGWPVITYGCTYGLCQSIGEGTTKQGMEQPLAWWPKPSTAPSGMAFYTGDRFPAWKGSVFVGALAGQTLWRLTLDGDKVVGRESLLDGQGHRVRTVLQGPDGWLYLLTDDPDGKILRLQAQPS